MAVDGDSGGKGGARARTCSHASSPASVWYMAAVMWCVTGLSRSSGAKTSRIRSKLVPPVRAAPCTKATLPHAVPAAVASKEAANVCTSIFEHESLNPK